MDFRTEAANATLRALTNSPGATLAQLTESGCVPVPGGRRVQCIAEVAAIFVSIGCLLVAILVLPLTLLGWFPPRWAAPVLLAGFALTLVTRKAKSWILRAYLRSRRDSLLKMIPNLPLNPVGLEDGKTHQKTKLVPEDEGVCLLDSDRRRLLIEGCSYRYVVYAKDVRSISPISGYALSGARLDCRMAGHDLDFVVNVAGHGPMASLVQAFSPATAAKGLAVVLNQTLFGTEADTFQQNALPPPLR